MRSLTAHFLRWWILVATIALTAGGAATAVAAPVAAAPEYQLKAVFLFNFAQFVEWPSNAFTAAGTPVIIGVLGEDPFGPYLDELIKEEKIAGRPLQIRRFRRVDEIRECHLLFVCRSETREMNRIITRVQERPVLTVSDADTFTRDGGMVRFALENGRIRLRINVEAAKAAGLNISSKILRLGTIVTPAKD